MSDRNRTTVLALDVGGANLKLAHGSGAVRSRAFPVWKDPGGLVEALARASEGLPPFDTVLLTLTAELCDCFETKADGVRHVVRAAAGAFPGRALHVWGLDGRFHAPEGVASRPEVAAAANWWALATAAAPLAGPGAGLLVDVGSTTTDMIPLVGGRPAARGRTDTERLVTGELVYAGVRRTPLCALGPSLPFRGRATRLCAEWFATTHDVYLTTGDLADDPDDRSTADGRPATRGAARDRLAHMVGADRTTFSNDDAARLARSADALLTARLVAAAGEAVQPLGGRPDAVVVSGSGEFLARRVAGRVVRDGGRIVSLRASWGEDASGAACAVALLNLWGVRADDSGG